MAQGFLSLQTSVRSDKKDIDTGTPVDEVAVVESTELSNGYAVPVFSANIPFSEEDLLRVIPAQMYGSLALTVALGFHTLPQIASMYGVSVEVLSGIMDIPEFREELADAIKKLKDKSTSGFAKRAAMIAENGLAAVASIITNPLSDDKDRLKAFNMISEMAGLAGKAAETGGSATASVTFNIGPGIRGISDGTQ